MSRYSRADDPEKLSIRNSHLNVIVQILTMVERTSSAEICRSMFANFTVSLAADVIALHPNKMKEILTINKPNWCSTLYEIVTPPLSSLARFGFPHLNIMSQCVKLKPGKWAWKRNKAIYSKETTADFSQQHIRLTKQHIHTHGLGKHSYGFISARQKPARRLRETARLRPLLSKNNWHEPESSNY